MLVLRFVARNYLCLDLLSVNGIHLRLIVVAQLKNSSIFAWTWAFFFRKSPDFLFSVCFSRFDFLSAVVLLLLRLETHLLVLCLTILVPTSVLLALLFGKYWFCRLARVSSNYLQACLGPQHPVKFSVCASEPVIKSASIAVHELYSLLVGCSLKSEEGCLFAEIIPCVSLCFSFCLLMISTSICSVVFGA